MQWYYVENEQRVGPVEENDFQQLVSSGTITPATLVWRSGMADWATYGSLSTAAPTTPAVPAVGAAQVSTGVCRECGRTFPLHDMVSYEGSTICAECKPKFFQRVQEGAAIGADGGGTGTTLNADLMAQARAALAGNWGQAVGVCLVAMLIGMAGGMVPFVGSVVSLLISGPIAVGMAIYFLALSRGGEKEFSMLFQGFKQFGTAVAAYLLMGIFIILWFFLLIVPGIIALLRYSQIFYIIADDPGIGPMQALDKSIEMMQGMKWKLVCLYFRFFGWSMLCMAAPFTLGLVVALRAGKGGLSNGLLQSGFVIIASFVVAMILSCIAFLWLRPYMSTSFAKFYDDVRGRVTAS